MSAAWLMDRQLRGIFMIRDKKQAPNGAETNKYFAIYGNLS